MGVCVRARDYVRVLVDATQSYAPSQATDWARAPCLTLTLPLTLTMTLPLT